jgi:uncharacterized protein
LVENFRWLNEPDDWREDSSSLTFRTGDQTDFWQGTFYGFHRDNGHAWLTPVEGDFTLAATVSGQYQHLYDQAGLMLRIDERNWIKTGIEYTDGLMHFSVVVTRGLSDWSVVPLPDARPSDELRVRLTRHGDAIRIQYMLNGANWQMARLAPFSDTPAHAGIMACSPQRRDFAATFTDIKIEPPIDRKLHDD